MSKRDSTPIRCTTTSTPNPAMADSQPDSEAPWQQLMIFNYVLFEVLDAMQQEQANGNHAPINHHWQQFVHHLRQSKPKLGAYLDNLPQSWQVQESPEVYQTTMPSVKTKRATVMTTGYPPLKSDRGSGAWRQIPWINLRGYWLEKVGFEIGTPYNITAINKQLIFTAE